MTEPRVGGADKNDGKAEAAGTAGATQRVTWSRVLVYGVLPGAALLLAMVAGFLKWQDSSSRDAEIAGIESVAAAKQTTIALLSFRPDTIEKDVEAARDRLTGGFRDTYLDFSRSSVFASVANVKGALLQG
jgi:Mce-associated membrane protein